MTRPPQVDEGHSMYVANGGLSSKRAERRAAPKPGRTPPGGRSMYASIGGLS
jgi:hypothetical protein